MSTPSSPADGGLAVATVVTRSHVAFARVLARSLAEGHPGLPLFCLFADAPGDGVPAAAEPFTVVTLDALDVVRPPHFEFRADPFELTVACKIWLLRHLLSAGRASVLYLDADMLALRELGPLLERARRHAMVLTPHLTAPAGTAERELAILRAGAYNGGVVGVSDRPETHRFLAWWQERVERHGGSAPDRALHFDQRWLDLAPGFVGDLHVERDPGINVGHWELPERLERVPAPPLVHFSGFDPAQPAAASRHVPGLAVAALGPAAPLFEDYAVRLDAAGHEHARLLPRSFDRYADGSPIPSAARARHRELGEGADRFGDPFRSGPGSYQAWFDAERL
jgi:hypothetical protein